MLMLFRFISLTPLRRRHAARAMPDAAADIFTLDCQPRLLILLPRHTLRHVAVYAMPC